jgi:hypothetical protein
MDHRRSLGDDASSIKYPLGELDGSFRGSVTNFLGNPHFRQRVVFKLAPTSSVMDERKELLTSFALWVKEEGPLGVRLCEELKSIIAHHFGFSKQDLFIYHSVPDPFVIIFSDRKTRDLVFAAARLIDGLIELSFNAWGLDDFGERVILPYHIQVSIEDIPQHGWSQEVVDKILCY